MTALEQFRATPPEKRSGYWKVENNALVEKTVEEKAVFDGGDLLACKKQTAYALAAQCNGFIQSKYTLENQQTISYLMDMAERAGKQQRFDYYNQVGVWATTILGYYYQVQDQIFAATTKDQINALIAGVNFAQFEATDPRVTIRAGFAIEP
jgi:hypothetical protein